MEISPETPTSEKEFKPEIDYFKWLVTEISHRLDGREYICHLNLKALSDLEDGGWWVNHFVEASEMMSQYERFSVGLIYKAEITA